MKLVTVTQEISVLANDVSYNFYKNKEIDLDTIIHLLEGRIKIPKDYYLFDYEVEYIFNKNAIEYNFINDSYCNINEDPVFEAYIEIESEVDLYKKIMKVIREIQALGFKYKCSYNRGNVRLFSDGTMWRLGKRVKVLYV